MSGFPKENKLTKDGVEYFYFDSSTQSQKTLVLLHGMGANKNVMWDLFKDYVQTYRVLALDLPGHSSARFCQFGDLKSLGDYVSAFIDALGLENVVLVGFSLGGLISLEVAHLRSSGITGVVVWASPVAGNPKGITKRGRAAWQVFKRMSTGTYEAMARSEKLKKLVGVKLSPLEQAAIEEFDTACRLKILHAIETWEPVQPAEAQHMFIFDPHDSLISKNNIVHARSLARSQDKILVKEYAGHYGMHNAWQEALGEVIVWIESL